MTPEQAQSVKAHHDLISDRFDGAEVEEYEARHLLRQEEQDARNREINELYNVASNEGIVMGDIDDIGADFTDDESAARIPGLEALMSEMGIGKMTEEPARAIGEST